MVTAFLNSTVFPVKPVKQAKMLKIGSHLQFWWPSGLVPSVWNRTTIIQTGVRIPHWQEHFFFLLVYLLKVVPCVWNPLIMQTGV